MLAEYLKDNIQIIDGGGIDWQEAIKISAKPLLESKSIQEEYVKRGGTFPGLWLGTHLCRRWK